MERTLPESGDIVGEETEALPERKPSERVPYATIPRCDYHGCKNPSIDSTTNPPMCATHQLEGKKVSMMDEGRWCKAINRRKTIETDRYEQCSNAVSPGYNFCEFHLDKPIENQKPPRYYLLGLTNTEFYEERNRLQVMKRTMEDTNSDIDSAIQYVVQKTEQLGMGKLYFGLKIRDSTDNSLHFDGNPLTPFQAAYRLYTDNSIYADYFYFNQITREQERELGDGLEQYITEFKESAIKFVGDKKAEIVSNAVDFSSGTNKQKAVEEIRNVFEANDNFGVNIEEMPELFTEDLVIISVIILFRLIVSQDNTLPSIIQIDSKTYVRSPIFQPNPFTAPLVPGAKVIGKVVVKGRKRGPYTDEEIRGTIDLITSDEIFGEIMAYENSKDEIGYYGINDEFLNKFNAPIYNDVLAPMTKSEAIINYIAEPMKYFDIINSVFNRDITKLIAQKSGIEDPDQIAEIDENIEASKEALWKADDVEVFHGRIREEITSRIEFHKKNFLRRKAEEGNPAIKTKKLLTSLGQEPKDFKRIIIKEILEKVAEGLIYNSKNKPDESRFFPRVVRLSKVSVEAALKDFDLTNVIPYKRLKELKPFTSLSEEERKEENERWLQEKEEMVLTREQKRQEAARARAEAEEARATAARPTTTIGLRSRGTPSAPPPDEVPVGPPVLSLKGRRKPKKAEEEIDTLRALAAAEGVEGSGELSPPTPSTVLTAPVPEVPERPISPPRRVSPPPSAGLPSRSPPSVSSMTLPFAQESPSPVRQLKPVSPSSVGATAGLSSRSPPSATPTTLPFAQKSPSPVRQLKPVSPNPFQTTRISPVVEPMASVAGDFPSSVSIARASISPRQKTPSPTAAPPATVISPPPTAVPVRLVDEDEPISVFEGQLSRRKGLRSAPPGSPVITTERILTPTRRVQFSPKTKGEILRKGETSPQTRYKLPEIKSKIMRKIADQYWSEELQDHTLEGHVLATVIDSFYKIIDADIDASRHKNVNNVKPWVLRGVEDPNEYFVLEDGKLISPGEAIYVVLNSAQNIVDTFTDFSGYTGGDVQKELDDLLLAVVWESIDRYCTTDAAFPKPPLDLPNTPAILIGYHVLASIRYALEERLKLSLSPWEPL